MFRQEYIDHLIRLEVMDFGGAGREFLEQDAERFEQFMIRFSVNKTPLARKIQNPDEEITELIARFKADDVDVEVQECLSNQAVLMADYYSRHPQMKDPVFLTLLCGYQSMLPPQERASNELLNQWLVLIEQSGITQKDAAPDRRFDALMATVMYLLDYDGFRQRFLQAYRNSKGLCPNCGGTFKGLLKKKCTGCGRPQ